ncbi:MAG TPA: dienelactone hydrolase family protein [Anaerolineales bacterium]|nr:dienelactone hydrolase family protein [Anaerolineales bacterium]
MESITFNQLTEQMVALYHQKKFEEAVQLIEQNLHSFQEQTARLTFWRMCFLSLTGRSEKVLSVFEQGLDSGLWWHAELFSDPDLNAVRDLPEFKRLMAVSQERYEEEQAQVERDYTILYPEPPSSGQYPLLITLHGRNGNKESDLERWELAKQRGWLVLSAQSTQPVFRGAYHWDNPERGLADLRFYYDQVSQQHQIDPRRVLIAGFSQGSGMAIYTALTRSLPVRGFMGIGTWWADPNQLDISEGQIRGYFVTGEKDHTRKRAREIRDVLRKNNVEFAEEVHTELGHEFSSDFGASFDKAVNFIFKEHE